MKGYAIALFLLISCIFYKVFSQDLITTSSGIEFKCKITSTDSINVYFNIRKGGQVLKTYISKADVKVMQYDTIPISVLDTIKFDKSHLFSINTGYSAHISKDDILSPFNYSGSNAPLNFDYKYLRRNSIQTFSLFFNSLKLKSNIPDLTNNLFHYTDNIYAVLDYSYNKKIFSKYNIQCFVGGKFKSLFNFRDHYPSSYGHAYNAELINSLGLNVILKKKYLTKNDFLYFNLNMPFLSYSVANDTYNSMGYFTQFNDISNPNINLWQIFKNGKMISLNKFIELQTELSYTKFITKRLGIGVKCGFDLYSFAEYEQLLYSKYLNTNILIGLTFKL